MPACCVACGGGSSSNTTSAGGAGGENTTPSITLTGVVAKGAALTGAAVEAKCASGTGTATTGTDGSYSITITSGELPCVLEATASATDGGMVLHSVALPGATTANITPLTELLVAQLTGQDPAAYMDTVSASALTAAVTTTTVGTAQTAVLSTLTAAGIDTSAISSTSLISGTLVAGSGTGYDGVLDTLATTLTAAGTTLTELVATVASTSAGEQGGNTAVVENSNPLPANLLLLPKASNCNALRSTEYRLIKIASSADDTDTSAFTATETMSLDATTLTASFGDDSTMTMVANGNCRYTLPEGDATVSPAGVMVIRAKVGADDDTVGAIDRGRYHMIVGLPKQAPLTVGNLAGTWNFMGMDRDISAPRPRSPDRRHPDGQCQRRDHRRTLFRRHPRHPGRELHRRHRPVPTIAAHADGGFTLSSGRSFRPLGRSHLHLQGRQR